MARTRTQLIRNMRIALIVVVAAIIIIYAVWRSLAYARGPKIEIFQPVNGSTAASSTIEIVGRADRVTSLTVDGSPISFDEQGGFRDAVIVFPGVNMVALDAADQFHRTAQVELEIFGDTDLPEAATGTAPRATIATSTATTSAGRG